MPVLVTIATVSALFRPGSEQISFLDPEGLRARCNDVIEDTETRHRALLLTEELMRLEQQYNTAVAASVEAYLTKSAQWDSSANDLIELLKPWDNARLQTVQGIIRVRLSMRELLTAKQWERVLG